MAPGFAFHSVKVVAHIVEVSEAVVTMPAYFNYELRQVAKDMGKIAGFEMLRIVNAPTPSPLTQGLEEKDNEPFMVCDLGVGTFDVSMLGLGGGVSEVLSVNGGTYSCGDGFANKTVVGSLTRS